MKIPRSKLRGMDQAFQSSGLREALKKAESALTNLEQSFGAYRAAAEARISYLEKSGRFFKYGFLPGPFWPWVS
jgi:hypothetical protein